MSKKNEQAARKRQIFHIASTGQWGVYYFVVYAVLGLMAGIFAVYHTGLPRDIVYSKAYPWIRGFLLVAVFCFSALTLAVAHLSYPRIHNLKVLLLGYLTFLTHILYIIVHVGEIYSPVVQRLAETDHRFAALLYPIIAMNLFIILSVPSFLKFRLTRAIVLTLVSAESLFGLYLAFGFFGHAALPDMGVGGMGWLLPFFFAVLLVLYSLKTCGNEQNLGGAVSGLVIIYAVSAAVRFSRISPHYIHFIEEASISLVSILILITMVGNWLARMSQRLYYDPLTQIYNREYCESILEERSNIVFTEPSCVAMFDIDYFKKVNDTYGHAAGDRVLQQVAQTLSREVVPNGIACRYGGEEIAVFFPGVSLALAKERCESVNRSVRESHVVSGRRKIKVTISVGVAEVKRSVVDALKDADKALYKAKEKGRDRVVVN